MALPPLRDLDAKYDVKGGSPRTPSAGVPVREYQEYVTTNGHGNGVWKAIATGLGGLNVGLLIAWFSALQGKGVTQKDMQEYVDKYSPVMPKDQAMQNTQIGEIRGRQEKLSIDLSNIQFKQSTDEHDFTEFKAKTEKNNEYWANFIEEQRKAKK